MRPPLLIGVADAGRPAVLRSGAFEALTPLPDASVNLASAQSAGAFSLKRAGVRYDHA
jgi:hypothetical protein